MARRLLRVLLVADTHLGIDLPRQPRIDRRRRGDDFFANYERALAPALDGRVDLVVHGGDVFFRSRVAPDVVMRAFAPLKRIADSGIPVVVVPGNHERSAIPYPLLAAHPGIHVIDSPRSVSLRVRDADVVIAGFPNVRNGVADRFRDLVEQSGWSGLPAEVRFLCVHQTFEGATVGPVGYVFRNGDDVIRGRDIPRGFTAVLSGHIHRHQVLTRDLSGRALAAPVFYPGSIERTSTAERDESKGYLIIEIDPDMIGTAAIRSWTFHPLPARPMVDLDLTPEDWSGPNVAAKLRRRLGELPPDGIVRIRLTGDVPNGIPFPLSSSEARSVAPETMNVEICLFHHSATPRRSS